MKNESLNWKMLFLELEDVVICNIIHSQRIHKMLQSKIVMEAKKMEEEYISGSNICALFVKEEVKFMIFSDYKKKFGQQNSTFTLKMNFIKACKPF